MVGHFDLAVDPAQKVENTLATGMNAAERIIADMPDEGEDGVVVKIGRDFVRSVRARKMSRTSSNFERSGLAANKRQIMRRHFAIPF